MDVIIWWLIYGCCLFHEKVGGLTGHPGLQAGALFVEAKHPEPPHYLCTTRQVVLGSNFVINTNHTFTPMHVG